MIPDELWRRLEDAERRVMRIDPRFYRTTILGARPLTIIGDVRLMDEPDFEEEVEPPALPGTGSICVSVENTECLVGNLFPGTTVRFQGPGGIDQTRDITCQDEECYDPAPAGEWTITVDSPCALEPYVESFTLGLTEDKAVNVDLGLWFDTIDYSDDFVSLTLTRVGTSCTWTGTSTFSATGVGPLTCPGHVGFFQVDGQPVTVNVIVTVTLIPNDSVTPGCGYKFSVSWQASTNDNQFFYEDCAAVDTGTQIQGCRWTGSSPDTTWGQADPYAGPDLVCDQVAYDGTISCDPASFDCCVVADIDYTFTLSHS